MVDTVSIDNRADIVLWAIERAKGIMSRHGSTFALAIQAGDEEAIRSAGNAMGQAITDALVEVFDGLVEP